MKLLLLVVLFAFASCHDPNYQITSEFKRHIPDTSKTWAGQMTGRAVHWTRILQEKFQLDSLEWGTTGKEIRIWNLSGSYDPQVLQIVRQNPDGECWLNIISFNHSKQDSILQKIRRRLTPGLLDSATVARLWTLPSQSEMTDGDTYGCMDGNDLLIELANAEHYKIVWYGCPGINMQKNTVFRTAVDFTKYINDNLIVK